MTDIATESDTQTNVANQEEPPKDHSLNDANLDINKSPDLLANQKFIINQPDAEKVKLLKPFSFVKVNTLNLHKNVKGILKNNGYFFVSDVMKHFKIVYEQQQENPDEDNSHLGLLKPQVKQKQDAQVRERKIEQIEDIKTDPQLEEE